MPPKRHLATASEFWADIGVSVQDQAAAASWAFTDPPAVPAEPGRRRLWEDQQLGWNALSAPASRDKPRRVLPGQHRLELLERLAEYAAPG